MILKYYEFIKENTENLIQVNIISTGTHTKGLFEDSDGNYYKSIELNPEKILDSNNKTTTNEYEILKELQIYPNIIRVGELVDTTEGKAFEVEKLFNIEENSSSISEFKKLENTFKEINDKGISYSDTPQIMRRENGELVITDFSNASKRKTYEEDQINMSDLVKYLKVKDRTFYLADRTKKIALEFKENEIDMDMRDEFIYYMTSREPSVGTHPIDNLIEEPHETTNPNNSNRRAYKLIYSEPLTEEEIKKYELLPEVQPYDYLGKMIKIKRSFIVVGDKDSNDILSVAHIENGEINYSKMSIDDFKEKYE